MKNRAARAEHNQLKIMASVRELWMEGPLNEITLEKVAERTGLTVRTVLRKFGSKEGMLEASVKHAAQEQMDRDSVEPGNLKAAVTILLDEYENMGDAVVRTIRAENEVPAAAEILKVGRAKHRAWCENVFAPFLPEKPASAREEQLLALIAATEVYLWKLLRRDLKISRSETHRIFLRMVTAIASNT